MFCREVSVIITAIPLVIYIAIFISHAGSNPYKIFYRLIDFFLFFFSNLERDVTGLNQILFFFFTYIF